MQNSLLNLTKYKSLSKRTKIPTIGCVELFAQWMKIGYTITNSSGMKEKHSRRIIVPPRVLQNQKASNSYDAVNDGVPQFSVNGLIKLASQVQYILLRQIGQCFVC